MPGQSFWARSSLVTAALAMTLSSRTTRAADTFRLSWSSPPTTPACPSSEKLAREVAAKLGRDPFDDTSTSEIRGSIERKGTSWVVKVGEYKDDKHVYTDESSPFDAPDCGDPHELAVHKIAVFIQTGRLGLSTNNDFAPKPAPIAAKSTIAPVVPAVKSTIPAKPETPTEPSAKPISRVSVSPHPFETHIFLGAGMSVGLLPAPSPAISLNAGFGRGRWEIDASLMLLPNTAHSTEPFSLGMTGGFVGGCFRIYNQPRVAFLGCGHAIVSAVHAFVNAIKSEAAGTTRTYAGDLPWVGLSASPRLRVVIAKPLTLQLGADLVVPLSRLDIYGDTGGPNERSVFTQTPIAVIPLAQIGVTIF